MERQRSTAPTPTDIRNISSEQVFGAKVIQNDFRSVVAECIVSKALGKKWDWCSADWFGWDFEHREDQCRLEVKQSARRQTWKNSKFSVPRFDISPRKGYFEGSNWIPQPGRLAAIYIFCWHPIDGNEVDHCDCEQWEFYVAMAANLPNQKSIGLGPLKKISQKSNFESLAGVVDSIKSQIR